MKIAIPQASLAQASIQNIEIGQALVGPVTIGQLTLNNVNFGFSTGQAELTNVSVVLQLQLTLVWSVNISTPFGNYTIASGTSSLGTLTFAFQLGNVTIPGIQQFTMAMPEIGMTNLQATVGPLSNLSLGSANASQVLITNVTLPTGGFQLTGMTLGSAQLADVGLPNGNIASVTVGDVKGNALPLAQLIIAGINLPRTTIANIVSGPIKATAIEQLQQFPFDLGVLDLTLQVTPSITMDIGQFALSGVTAAGTIGSADINGITIPYDIRNLTLTDVTLNTLQIPGVGVA